jgi:hypothetical protein
MAEKGKIKNFTFIIFAVIVVAAMLYVYFFSGEAGA